MKKKKYIAPETVVIHVPTVPTLMTISIKGEKKLQVGESSNMGERYDIVDGKLQDGEWIASKHHNGLWDDEE